MTASEDQRGPWTVADDPGNCSMCSVPFEPGAQVRHDPDAGGQVCGACGQDEPVPRIVDQFFGDQEDSSLQ